MLAVLENYNSAVQYGFLRCACAGMVSLMWYNGILNAPVNNTPHYPTPVLYRGIDWELTGVFPLRVGEIDMG